MTRRSFSLVGAFVGLAALLYGPSVALAQVAPPPGAALQQFSVFGHSGVTGSAGAGTIVVGDVGSFPTPAITNFSACAGCCSTAAAGFTVHCAANATTLAARGDATAAFLALNQGVGTVLPADLSLANGTGVITSGIYTFLGGAALLPAGQTVTFSGPGIFVLRTASTLTTVVGSNVLLAAGANSCNIFWQIGDDATLSSIDFRGQVFAGRTITLPGPTNVIGKLVAGGNAGTGAVTMAVGGNTIGGCAAAGPPVPALPEVATLALLVLVLGTGAYILSRR